MSVAKLATHGIKALLRELTPEEDEEVYASPHADPSRPWLEEFREYLDTREGVPEQFSTVDWWGVRGQQYVSLSNSAYNCILALAERDSLSNMGITCPGSPLDHGFIGLE